MDYYQTMRNDYIKKDMYPEDPMRVDWIPKGPPTGTLTIKPKDRCSPRFVSKIEGNAVEEGVKVFFEGIVDAQPNPKFCWYFNDEPVFPGQKGWEDAEIHDSRKMSTLILKYAREHHMGKYTLVAQNQLGAAECNCDLIVRKKQFPPVFWQRLYNVNGEGSRRFVGDVEVGGWPVPVVTWYKVMEDGEEVEVKTRTHTENYNGFPNKYVPDRRIEVRQIDDIRHCIIFASVSEGDSGLYRVRAVNALGEAECEAELNFDGCGGGDDMYLPPGWQDKQRMTWKIEDDMRKKAFVDYQEPELTDEEIAAMRNKCAGVPLGRIMEYLASLPNYEPSNKFRGMERIPFKPGVDEHDYRPDNKGGADKLKDPSVFIRGKFTHHGYNTDKMGRILPVWFNESDPNAVNSINWSFSPVIPELTDPPSRPPRTDSPPCPHVWEDHQTIGELIELLKSMGCRITMENLERNLESLSNKTPIKKVENRQYNTSQSEATQAVNHQKQKSTVEKYSYIMPNQEKQTSNTAVEHLPKAKHVKEMWEEKLKADTIGSQTTAQEFTSRFMSQMYNKQDNLSFPEIAEAEHPPALPPKKKIMFSPSRNIFSPTESIEGNDIESNGTGSLQTEETVVVMGVKEKAKLIASQQEELLRKESEASSNNENTKIRGGVRLLPASPITVRQSPITVRQSPVMMRQMSVESYKTVESELHEYDSVVTRTPPVTPLMDKNPPQPTSQIYEEVQNDRDGEVYYSEIESGVCQSTSNHKTMSSMTTHQQVSTHQQVINGSHGLEERQEQLEKSENKYKLDQDIDQLIAETESLLSEDMKGDYWQPSAIKQQMTSMEMSMDSYNSSMGNVQKTESPAEKCRRSFEEAELEAAMTQESVSSQRSSILESSSIQSFNVFHEQTISTVQENFQEQNYSSIQKSYQDTNSSTTSVQQVSVPGWGTPPVKSEIPGWGSPSEKIISETTETTTRGRPTTKTGLSTRTPETFIRRPPQSPINSTPATPSTARRLRINQSPKPPDSEIRPKYRDSPSSPFQPGFYRPPPDDPNQVPNVFQMLRRNSSKTRISIEKTSHHKTGAEEAKTSHQHVRVSGMSQTSSRAYEGDNESCSEDGNVGIYPQN